MGRWDQQFVRSLWGRIDPGERYDFPTGPTARQRLRDILPSLPTRFFDRDQEQLNKPLREELTVYLKAGDRRSLLLARWIIKDWGGINKGLEVVPRWMESLSDFSEINIRAFLVSIGTNRISSWSKLLAFANHEHHAIYDARTSVALNCALRGCGDGRQFSMPDSQNKIIKRARLRLLKDAPARAILVGYADYIELLNTSVACKMSNSILAAEMMLFANAPRVAGEFIANENNRSTGETLHRTGS